MKNFKYVTINRKSYPNKNWNLLPNSYDKQTSLLINSSFLIVLALLLSKILEILYRQLAIPDNVMIGQKLLPPKYTGWTREPP